MKNPSHDRRAEFLEFLGLICPVLGLVFWAVYANTMPNRAWHIGVASLVGVGAGIAFFVVVKVMMH